MLILRDYPSDKQGDSVGVRLATSVISCINQYPRSMFSLSDVRID